MFIKWYVFFQSRLQWGFLYRVCFMTKVTSRKDDYLPGGIIQTNKKKTTHFLARGQLCYQLPYKKSNSGAKMSWPKTMVKPVIPFGLVERVLPRPNMYYYLLSAKQTQKNWSLERELGMNWSQFLRKKYLSVFCLIYSLIPNTSLHISSWKPTDEGDDWAVSSFLKIQKAFSKVSSSVSAIESKLTWDENQNSDMAK